MGPCPVATALFLAGGEATNRSAQPGLEEAVVTADPGQLTTTVVALAEASDVSGPLLEELTVAMCSVASKIECVLRAPTLPLHTELQHPSGLKADFEAKQASTVTPKAFRLRMEVPVGDAALREAQAAVVGRRVLCNCTLKCCLEPESLVSRAARRSAWKSRETAQRHAKDQLHAASSSAALLDPVTCDDIPGRHWRFTAVSVRAAVEKLLNTCTSSQQSDSSSSSSNNSPRAPDSPVSEQSSPAASPVQQFTDDYRQSFYTQQPHASYVGGFADPIALPPSSACVEQRLPGNDGSTIYKQASSRRCEGKGCI